MSHDPICEKHAATSEDGCWVCRAISEARADERAKAADRLARAWVESETAEGYTLPLTLALAAIRGTLSKSRIKRVAAVVGGEQE